MAGPHDPNGGSEPKAAIGSAHSLNYLCELIVELKHLADRSGQRTLSAILAAALTEARIQSEEKLR
jgi:hypothetical protein